jgi:hypothetical protein
MIDNDVVDVYDIVISIRDHTHELIKIFEGSKWGIFHYKLIDDTHRYRIIEGIYDRCGWIS